jgi:hypothetical protein
VVVRPRLYLAAVHVKGVIVRRTAQSRRGKPVAKFNPLHGGYAEHRRRQPVLDSVENRVAYTHRHPRNNTFYDTAHGIPRKPRFLYFIEHLLIRAYAAADLYDSGSNIHSAPP